MIDKAGNWRGTGGRLRWVLVFLLSAVLAACIGSSTNTDDCLTGTTSSGGSSTDTDDCLEMIEVISVDISRGKLVEPLPIGTISEDSSGIIFDNSTAIIAVPEMSATSFYFAGDIVGDTVSTQITNYQINGAAFAVGTVYPADSGLLANVMDDDGNLLSSVQVSIRDADYAPPVSGMEPPMYEGLSDANGIVTFRNMSAGNYLLTGKIGTTSVLFYRRLVYVDTVRSQFVILQPQNSREYLGSFRRESGLPVDSIQVYVPGTSANAVTGSSGSFSMGVLPVFLPGIRFNLNSVSIPNPVVPIDTVANPNPTLQDSVMAGLCGLNVFTDFQSIQYAIDSSQTPWVFNIADVDRASCQ